MWTWCATFNTSCFTNICKRPRPARGRPGLEHSRRRCNVKSAPSGTYVRVGARSRGGLEASILAAGQQRRCEALWAGAYGKGTQLPLLIGTPHPVAKQVEVL